MEQTAAGLMVSAILADESRLAAGSINADEEARVAIYALRSMFNQLIHDNITTFPNHSYFNRFTTLKLQICLFFIDISIEPAGRSKEECRRGARGQQIQIIMEGQIAKIIIPMLKNQTVNTKQHEFILSKISPSSLECILLSDFRPTQKPDQPFECITPRFNQDAAYFTPAFTLPIDQKFYRENANFERLKFDERIQNASERLIVKNNYNFLPPSNYCQLCKTSFQDYLEHTHLQQHSQQITASIANHFIQELAGQFKPACRKTKRIGRKKVEEKRMERSSKRSCKMSGSNINNIAAKRGVSDAKNSNHSTNLISSSG